MRYGFGYFPFRRDNRKSDGRWDAPDATRDSIRGTSVDPDEPVWPRWRESPPLHHEGDFVSVDPFYDIDEISGRVEFYPPGRPLRDGNVDGNPARRQRVGDLPAGNSWRRRLLVSGADESAGGQYQPDDEGVRLAQGDPNSSRVVTRRPQGFPPPPNPPWFPEWLLPRPFTIQIPNPFGGPPRNEAAPGWTYDQHYWQLNPSTGERYLYKPFEPNTNADANNNGIPDNVEPGNPTGSYLFPALISALRRQGRLG